MPLCFSGKREVYIEIAERYEEYIRSGIYKSGDKLPSVRAAANELGVNPNTVARAFSVLEEKGLVVSLPKKGAFVTADGEGAVKKVSEAIELLTRLKAKGFTEKELIEMIREVFDE